MLKKIRIIVSVFFFSFWGLYFLAEISFIKDNSTFFSSFQLFPALQWAKSVGVFPLGLTTIIILTILFGRVYCSSMCPLGTFQDGFIALSRKVSSKKCSAASANTIIRYGVLGVFLLLFFLGVMSLVHFLEPFSVFGRIASGLFSPMLYGGAVLLEAAGLPLIASTTFHTLSWGPIIVASLLTGALIIASVKQGRLFCNTLCPVGAVLGLISRISFFKIFIDKKKCISCGACEKVCKAGCADASKKSIDFSRCVSCMNCLKVCPEDALHFGRNTGEKTSSQDILESRRLFIKNSLMAGGSLALLAIKPLKLFAKKKSLIVPAGSKSLESFSAHCTSCHLCVSHCPTKVLQPSFDSSQWSHFLQPAMDYQKSYCEYQCNTCSEVCPSGAIQKITLAEKQRTQIGQVDLIKHLCVVYKNQRACGACAEHCPTTAVRMVAFKDGLEGPVVDPKLCIGCGHCENVCPARPKKAIIVRPLEKHGRAVLPKKGKIRLESPKKKKFPF